MSSEDRPGIVGGCGQGGVPIGSLSASELRKQNDLLKSMAATLKQDKEDLLVELERGSAERQ